MRDRSYGQFCGLARAAEVLGQRWTLLVLRDLLVGPRRYSDLLEGLPGIPTSGLARRLRELEADGLVIRELSPAPERAVIYRPTDRARDLVPALDALSRWGAAEMHEPRPGEVVTTASLASALRAAAGPGRAGAGTTVYEVHVGDAVAHAVVDGTGTTVGPGPHPDADLALDAGPALRDVLAGTKDLDAAIREGETIARGDDALVDAFTATFRVPYAPAARTVTESHRGPTP